MLIWYILPECEILEGPGAPRPLLLVILLLNNTTSNTMAASMQVVTSLTPEELNALDKKPDIKIQWRQKASSGKLQTVFEEFPRALAMAFSPIIHNNFTQKPHARVFNLEGATLETSKTVFEWMFHCCKQGRMVPLPHSSAKKLFAVYLNIYVAASNLEVTPLKNDVYIKLSTLANTEFQCAEDINELYYYFKAGHPMRMMIVHGTAKCWLTGKFGKVGKTWTEYYNEIVPEFEEGVRQQFKKEMNDFDPQWAEKQKQWGKKGMEKYRKLEEEDISEE